MNPLNSNSPLNNFNQNQFNTFGPQNQPSSQDRLMAGVHKAKEMMQAMRGNPAALVQEFPELKPFMQERNLEGVFRAMCQAKGIDPNVVINELRG